MTGERSSPNDTAALFLVRVRLEAGSDPPLRAFIRSTGDVRHGFESSATLVDVEDVVAMLRNWLQETIDSLTV